MEMCRVQNAFSMLLCFLSKLKSSKDLLDKTDFFSNVLFIILRQLSSFDKKHEYFSRADLIMKLGLN